VRQAREILGVPAVVEQFGLSGDGQVIALTDSGLDRQSRLSADFAGRVAAAFAPSDMSSACSRANWDDFDGHGTHVAGTALGSSALAANNSYHDLAPVQDTTSHLAK
jgi:subtilisin family serine protease